jgi:hypothetical protein
MVLLGFEGFEHKTPGLWNRGNILTSGSGTIAYVAGRYGGTAYRNNTSSANQIFPPTSSYTGLYVGYALFAETDRNTSGRPYFGIFGPEGVRQYMWVGGVSGQVGLYRGSTDALVAAAPGAPVSMGAWNYLECFSGPLNATTGHVIVRVNGATVIDFTGNTLGGGTVDDTPGPLQYISVYVTSIAGQLNTNPVDDLYICTDAGSAPYNGFLGDCKVETLIPSNNGTFSQLLGSDGNSTDNYQLVDEQPPAVADYVGSATVGQRDTYAFTDLVTTSGTVHAVQTMAYALKSDAGTGNIKTVQRLGSGTERVSSSIALPSTAGWVTAGPQTTDPAGAAWTIGNVNASEFGVEVA